MIFLSFSSLFFLCMSSTLRAASLQALLSYEDDEAESQPSTLQQNKAPEEPMAVVVSAPAVPLVHYDDDEDDEGREGARGTRRTENRTRVVLHTESTASSPRLRHQPFSISPATAAPPTSSPLAAPSPPPVHSPLPVDPPLPPSPSHPLANVIPPPDPQGDPPPGVTERVVRLLRMRDQGIHLNVTLKRRKDYRNPDILEKFVAVYEVNELGSNYDKETFDPHGYSDAVFYDALAEEQRKFLGRRIAAQTSGQRSSVDFVKEGAAGGAGGGTQPPAGGGDVKRKRVSKWDRGAPPASSSMGIVPQSMAQQAIPSRSLYRDYATRTATRK